MSPKPVALRLPYREPYDFAGLLGFLARRSIPEVEAADERRYRRVLAGGKAWIEVAHADEGPAVTLRMHGVPARERAAVAARARAVFDLDADPAPINKALRRVPLLRPSVRRHPGLRVVGSWDGFDLAVRAVLGQQISVAGARTLAARLVARAGTRLDAGALTHLFPAPEALAEASFEGIGTTRNVAETLRGIARATAEGRLSFDPEQPLDEFVARFTALRGIGPWSAHYVAMRALRHADAFPASDLVLCQVAGAPGPALKPRALEDLAEPWRPYRSYAVMHLWRMAVEAQAKRALQATRTADSRDQREGKGPRPVRR